MANVSVLAARRLLLLLPSSGLKCRQNLTSCRTLASVATGATGKRSGTSTLLPTSTVRTGILNMQAAKSVSTTCQSDGLYELRTYTVQASQMASFLNLTKEKLHLRTAHSQLIGYWTSELGGLNEVVHIWYYESLESRANVRKSLSEDPTWLKEYIKDAAPVWQKQDNTLLLPIPGIAVSNPTSKGVYELQTIDMTVSSSIWTPKLKSFVGGASGSEGADAAGGKCCLVGAWQAVVGRLNSVVLLWHYPNQDAAVAGAAAHLERGSKMLPLIKDWKNKILLPHSVSPLQ